jgi:CRP-like cAMP-binding protein
VDPTDVLLRTPVFRDLSRRDVDELLPSVRQLVFARGDALWNEGDRAEALYVIAEGQVKSYRVSSEGGELILQVVTSGSLLGEPGVFHPSGARRVSVRAMEPTICLTIGKEPLLAYLTRHPAAMRRMLECLSDLAFRAVLSLSDVAFEDIRKRVARTLLDLADEQGEPTTSGVRIPIKLSQTTLAAMVAATRENVNRALALFLTRGELSHRDGFFFVHRREALEEVAEAV